MDLEIALIAAVIALLIPGVLLVRHLSKAAHTPLRREEAAQGSNLDSAIGRGTSISSGSYSYGDSDGGGGGDGGGD